MCDYMQEQLVVICGYMWDSWLGNIGNYYLLVLYVVIIRQDFELDFFFFKVVNKFLFYIKVVYCMLCKYMCNVNIGVKCVNLVFNYYIILWISNY